MWWNIVRENALTEILNKERNCAKKHNLQKPYLNRENETLFWGTCK